MDEENLINSLLLTLMEYEDTIDSKLKEIRRLLVRKEYHSACNTMTELTLKQANVGMELRSVLIKHGFLESEL